MYHSGPDYRYMRANSLMRPLLMAGVGSCVTCWWLSNLHSRETSLWRSIEWSGDYRDFWPALQQTSPSSHLYRDSDDSLDSLDPRWRPHSPLSPAQIRLKPTRLLPDHCMEQWFADGELTCGLRELGEEESLDAVWMWVNGSDPRWLSRMDQYAKEEGIEHSYIHYREQGELAASLRSVVESLPGKLGTLHLMTADFPFEEGDTALLPRELAGVASVEDMLLNWRVAQTPTWLEFSRADVAFPTHPYHPQSSIASSRGLNIAEKTFPTLRFATESEIFHLPIRDGETSTEHQIREREWRSLSLPTFNSNAVESRRGWVPGLGEVMIAMNDDIFITAQHAVSDFHSPLYGPVFQYNHALYAQPAIAKIDDHAMDGAMMHANWLLSKRFWECPRPYNHHVAHVLTRSLQHEASIMFDDDFFTSTKRRFRAVAHGEGDVSMDWLVTTLGVERWREALLWTYIVANIGQLEAGFWGAEARSRISALFEVDSGNQGKDKIEVRRAKRQTLENMERVFERSGWEAPKRTTFEFSSLDGHMPMANKGHDQNKCTFSMEVCLGTFWSEGLRTSAESIFKRMAFERGDCGNCLIMKLVGASGSKGLSQFFPEKGSTFKNSARSRRLKSPLPPHLPLTPTWWTADFSLPAVIASTNMPGEKVDLRLYTMKLLSRYLYTTGQSHARFRPAYNAQSVDDDFMDLERSPEVSQYGINDEIGEDYPETKKRMMAWFDKRWPRKMVWERGWDPVKDQMPNVS